MIHMYTFPLRHTYKLPISHTELGLTGHDGYLKQLKFSHFTKCLVPKRFLDSRCSMVDQALGEA